MQLGNPGSPPHVPVSGLSGTQLYIHALHAFRALKQPQAQVRGVTALQQAADMCAVLGGHHAAHAHGGSNVGKVQSHNTQSTAADTSLLTVQIQRPGFSHPRMLQPHHSPYLASD
jgi:hypothetical protein